MAGNNPVFGKIEKQLRQEQYAGFNTPQQQQQGGAYYPPSPQQLDQMYQRPSAGPLDTGRVTFDDVIMKALGLFAVLVVAAGATWATVSVNPRLVGILWMGGMFGGLAVGFAIAFMRKVSVPLIVLYAVLEGLFVGAISRVLDARYPGIVMTAVVATMCTFAGMFIGYKTGVIKVTAKSRRIFGMMVIGYMLFAVVNLVSQMLGWTSGWGFGDKSGFGIIISLIGVALASYSLAVDFDSIDSAIRLGAPQKYSWLLAHGLIVSLVWLYIEILRLLARLRGD